MRLERSKEWWLRKALAEPDVTIGAGVPPRPGWKKRKRRWGWNMRWFADWLKRALPTWLHEWEPLILSVQSTYDGLEAGCAIRHTKICAHCGRTYPFRDLPCTHDRNDHA